MITVKLHREVFARSLLSAVPSDLLSEPWVKDALLFLNACDKANPYQVKLVPDSFEIPHHIAQAAQSLVRRGEKVAAIKLIRADSHERARAEGIISGHDGPIANAMKIGLKDAKDIVETLERAGYFHDGNVIT